MNDARYFTRPKSQWQRRYETLRASFVERLPAHAVARRFDYSAAYVRLLRHQFAHGKIDFSEPLPEGKKNRYRVSNECRQKIRQWRENNMSCALGGESQRFAASDASSCPGNDGYAALQSICHGMRPPSCVYASRS